ncbi:MAG: GGDEF domain-containing protein [Campylobacterota bacterium]|nr:GGDEF domain-containing protein [Campylobacterota bacterium]
MNSVVSKSEKEVLLDKLLSKNMFEFIVLDSQLNIVEYSTNSHLYVDCVLSKGDTIFSSFPELVGYEDELEDILNHDSMEFMLETVSKNQFYVTITLEAYGEGRLILFLHNITNILLSKQQMLQYSNESLLLNATLQKILDSQNAYVFVVHKEKITFINKRFAQYFNLNTVSINIEDNLKIYQYLDIQINGYDALFNHLQNKEETVVINNDTFILKASIIESTHQLFTLTKITDISNKLQFDPLTSAYRKEFFHKQLDQFMSLEEEGVLVLFDIDDFKQINERHGKEIANSVLKEFAILIKDNIRDTDTLARWREEEFLLLLRNISLDRAMLKVKNLSNIILDHKYQYINHLTCCIGIASKSENDTSDSLLIRSDQALFEAKKSGKNNIVQKLLKNKNKQSKR